MSKLLISENPLVIIPTLATKIGLNEAIVLQQIHYWLVNPMNHNHREDRIWVFKTFDGWLKEFPFFSLRTIKRIIKNLEDWGLILSTSTFNKKKDDRTKWYSVNYEKVESLDVGTLCQNGTNVSAKLARTIVPNWHNDNKEETTTEITTDIKTNIDHKSDNEHKKVGSLDEKFEEFWAAYPNKKAKQEAKKMFTRKLVSKPDCFEKIMASIPQQIREKKLHDELGLFHAEHKFPAGWLKDERWLDSVMTEEAIREKARREKLAKGSGSQNAVARAAGALNVARGTIERDKEALLRRYKAESANKLEDQNNAPVLG